MIAIDILYLVDRLEALLVKGWRVPMTTKSMIDEDEFLDIIDQMRIAIPEEIKQSKKLVQERERFLAQTQEQSQQITNNAREDAARLVNEHAILKEAQKRAMEIEAEAKAEALRIRQGADQYAADSLHELKGQLDLLAQQVAALQAQVYNGLNMLAGQAPPPETTQRDENIS
jgi:hypothetical protein